MGYRWRAGRKGGVQQDLAGKKQESSCMCTQLDTVTFFMYIVPLILEIEYTIFVLIVSSCTSHGKGGRGSTGGIPLYEPAMGRPG